MSQAEDIRDLLIERLELFDPSLDTASGSPLWNDVIQPMFEALGTDPFDTDIRTFLQDRITQSFPNISAQDGDQLADLLITPIEVLFEPLKREIQRARTGQSVNNAAQMRLEDAQDLAANFFVDWRSGVRASGVVRIFYANPTYVNVLATTIFSTPEGLRFFPTTPVLVRPEEMLLQRSGNEYYVDVPVVAEFAGAEYNVAEGSITSAEGLSGYSRITNLQTVEDGDDAETVQELLDRTAQSLTERTLNVRRGIVARLRQDFPNIVDVEVVGMGDPEQNRDIITGGGEGSVVSSGVCIIVGQYVLMFNTFEDSGLTDSRQLQVGDEIELNFWDYLYEAGIPNESFSVSSILFDSKNAISQMPSVTLFQIDGVPSVTAPVAGTLPGVLPGVFAVVRGPGKIEISDIPGGILNPNTTRGTIEIDEGEVHIGGHYDVWIRPSSPTTVTADVGPLRSTAPLLEGTDLVVSGESGIYRHLVHRAYRVTVTITSGTLQPNETLSVVATGASARAGRISAQSTTVLVLELWEMNGIEFSVGDSIVGLTTGGTATVSAVDAYDWSGGAGVQAGMVLSIVRGTETGTYRVLKVDGSFLYLDVELTTTALDTIFRILTEIAVDAFDPKEILVPFGDALGDDLRTVIGSSTLRTDINLQDFGVEEGDTLEILSGDDQGVYAIQSFDEDIGGSAPVLSVAMTATNSGLTYEVYRASDPLQRPLVRLEPGGVTLLDPAGQDSGYTIPPAQPVDARSAGAFSGSRAVAVGANGFVLMDPGPTWAPTADYQVDIDSVDWTAVTGSDFETFYASGNFKRCATDECAPCEDGYIAVISIYDDGSMWLDSNLPSNVQTFLQNMKDWFLGVIDTFNFGGDEEELINGLSPIRFGPNTDGTVTLLLQFEVCIPFSVFDGCDNVFVAIPEFDWETEFAETETFSEAVALYNNGTMSGRDPALLQAQPGDVITVLSGPNVGSYIIDKVHQYYLVAAGHIEESDVDLNDAYKVAMVTIRDQFPVPPLFGLSDYFDGTAPTWSLPAAPSLPFNVSDTNGDPVEGWDYVESALTWFFQLLNGIGFDLPSNIALDVPSTLRAFWQSMFQGYIVSRPTASQYVRMHFVEPTSCTVQAPTACAQYTWAPPQPTPAALVGANITLPLPDLSGLSVSMVVRRLSDEVTLSGTLTTAFDTVSTLSDLALLLQELLDSRGQYVLFSGPATATGALTVTQAVGGVDEELYITAQSSTDGFFILGFRESEPGSWPESSTSGPAVAGSQEVITYTQNPSTNTLGFDIVNVTSDLVLITGTAAVGTISAAIGTTITGNVSGATGTLWAFRDDSTGVEPPLFWLTNVIGVFQVGENLIGGGGNTTTAVDINPALTSTNVSIDDDQEPGDTNIYFQGTFEETAAFIQQILEVELERELDGGVATADPYNSPYDTQLVSPTFEISASWQDNGNGTGSFVLTIRDTNPTYADAWSAWQIDNASGSSFDPQFVETYMATSSARPLVSVSGAITGDGYAPTIQSPTIDINDTSGDVFDIAFDLDYFESVTLDTELIALINANDFSGAAQYLNANADYYADTASSARALLWVGTDTELICRVLAGGPDVTATPAGLTLLGFVDTPFSGATPATNAVGIGSTAAGVAQTFFRAPRPPTLFVAAAGAAELLYTPSLDASPLQVFPVQDEDGDTPLIELPRDLRIGDSYTGQSVAELAFTDSSFSAPVVGGVEEGGDFLYLYEQLTMLDITASDVLDNVDRVVAVTTEFGSNIIRIPDFGDDDEFNFFSPAVNPDNLPLNRVEVGDLVFIEEGEDAAGYIVIDRDTHALTLDRPLTESTGRVYSTGNDGVIDPDATNALFRTLDVSLSDDDIGRFLTIWGTNRPDFDGSYRITAVDAGTGTLTLETDPWTDTETDIHFAIVRAPTTDPGASATGGRTELVGLRPIRLYRGTATQWRVAYVSPDLSRTEARMYVAFGDSTTGPRQGVNQPYRIVRPGVQHISSTAMSGQSDSGFYYFDVLAHSLGGDELFNIPADVKMEPVFGTYTSEGYRMEVADNRLSYSVDEQASIVFTPTFLPNGFDNDPQNLVKVEGRTVRISHEYAPAAAQAQRIMTSDADRVLCANVLVRHFLPSFVTFQIEYDGGARPSVVAEAIIDYINGLSSVEELDVSKLEKILHANSVVRYSHPVYIWTVTHDLDRRLVAVRSNDRINDNSIPYNGTNRITFFIAGPDRSATDSESEIPLGERVYLTRDVSAATVR